MAGKLIKVKNRLVGNKNLVNFAKSRLKIKDVKSKLRQDHVIQSVWYNGLQNRRGWDAFIDLHGLLVLHYACTANGINFLDQTIFGWIRLILAAKVGPPGPNLGD